MSKIAHIGKYAREAIPLFLILLGVFGVLSNVQAQEIFYQDHLDFGEITEYTAGVFGVASTYVQKVAMEYSPQNSQWICRAQAYITRTATLTNQDSVLMKVYSGGTEPENGSLVSTSTTFPIYSQIGVTTASGSSNFVFENCFSVTGGTTYYFVLERTGTIPSWPGTNNQYFSYNKNTSEFTYTNKWYKDGTWTEQANYEVYINLQGYAGLDIENMDSPTASDSWWNLSGAEEACNDAFPSSGSWNPLNMYNLCVGIGFLWIPSPEAVHDSVQVREELLTKWPFNWMGELYETFYEGFDPSNVASTSYASFSFTNLDLDTNASHSVSFTLFNTASASEWMNPQAITTARNILLWIMVLAWAISMWSLIVKWI